MAKVFVSYNYNSDGIRIDDLRSLISNPMGSQRHEAVTVTDPVEPGGNRDRRIQKAIKAKMDLCEAVVFLVGDDTHNSRWITYEVELACQRQLPYVVVQGKGTTGGPPSRLAGDRILPWESSQIGPAIDRALAAGRHSSRRASRV